MGISVFSRQSLSGRTTFGASCVVPSSLTAEALGRTGLDWVIIDCQHGLVGFEAMVSMLQSLALSPVLPLVRVAENSGAEIGRALDAGAGGVIVPMVDSRREAEAAVRAARYPPIGARSWGPTRAAWPGLVTTDPPDGLLFVMVETAKAFAEAEAIVSTPGVDGAFVGTSDLAVSLGLAPRDSLHPRIREHASRLAQLCHEAGAVAAIGAQTAEQASVWLETGFQMLSLGRDLGAMVEHVSGLLETFRRLDGGRTASS